MNNDVEIETNNFEEKVSEIYEREKFHLLGPDIYSTTYHLHQNPKRCSHYTYDEVKKLNQKFKKESQISLSLKIKCWLNYEHLSIRKEETQKPIIRKPS